MNKRVAPLLIAACFLVASCGGGGGSGGTPVDSEFSITLPGFPHQIDIYDTAGADKAVVFLHGALGTNYRFAFDLGLNSVDAPPTGATVNWPWLEANRILAVFPQGQARSGVGYTWNNHVMDSGQDDVAFLQALATYIRTQYGISTVYIVGHSNGGMMVNRMWCESPDTFSAYVAIAGPTSNYYSDALTPCAPAVVKPYYGIVGELDNVLQVTGNWDAQTWTINPILVVADAANFVDPILIAEWRQHQARSQLMCGQAPVDADKTSDGSVETWTNCSGRIELQRGLSGGHLIELLEAAFGTRMIDLVAAFVGGL